MPTVASGILAAWPSTAASIPAGWSRKTSLDGYYIQGAGAGADADLSTVRGNASHTHTSPSHAPTQNSHTHTFNGASGGGSSVGGADSPFFPFPKNKHTHATTTSNSTTAVNDGVSITVNSSTNSLPYIEVIFIESNGTPTGVPVGGLAFFESDTLPTSWTRAHGDKYLKGAAAAGDGGGTGGSATHNHTSPAHTHTQQAHGHAAKSSAFETATHVDLDASGGGIIVAGDFHTHDVTLTNTTATNNSVTTTISTDNHEPVYKKYNLISNGAAGADLPDSLILMWGSTNASIPTNWARLTGLDGKFPKHANADGESTVTTGGSTTHTHTASDCQPTQNSHTHGYTSTGPSYTDSTTGTSFLVTNMSTSTHTHTQTIGSKTATNNAATVTIDTSAAEDAYPQYKRVIFIKYTAPTVSAVAINRMMMGMGI